MKNYKYYPVDGNSSDLATNVDHDHDNQKISMLLGHIAPEHSVKFILEEPLDVKKSLAYLNVAHETNSMDKTGPLLRNTTK